MNDFLFRFRAATRSQPWRSAWARSQARPPLADGDIYVHAGANFKPVTIAVTPFAGEQAGDKIGGCGVHGFCPARSSFCRSIRPASPKRSPILTRRPNLDAWKTAGAQFVLTGQVLHQDAGARHRAIPFVGHPRPANRSRASNIRPTRRTRARVSHMIADAVFSRVTGEERVFSIRGSSSSTRRVRSKKRHKRLAVMDMDGANVKYLDGGKELVVTPRFLAFRPAGRLYVVWRRRSQGDPAQSRYRTTRSPWAIFPGMTFAPRFLSRRSRDRAVSF